MLPFAGNQMNFFNDWIIKLNMIRQLKYLLFIQLVSLSFGQFGQNIVQYDNFSWHFIQSKHFDIYYAEDGRSHAEFTADEAETAYLKISDRLN